MAAPRITITGDEDVALQDAARLLTPENLAFAKQVVTAEKLVKDAVTEAYVEGEAESKNWVEVLDGLRGKGSFVEREDVNTTDVWMAAMHAAMEVIKDRNRALYDKLHKLVNSSSVSACAEDWGVKSHTSRYITHFKFENETPRVSEVTITLVEEGVEVEA